MFDNKNDFRCALSIITAVKGRAMVIDKAFNSQNKEDKIFYFHAPKEQEPFQVGTAWSRKIIESRFNPEWKEDMKKRKAEAARVDPSEGSGPRKRARGAADKELRIGLLDSSGKPLETS